MATTAAATPDRMSRYQRISDINHRYDGPLTSRSPDDYVAFASELEDRAVAQEISKQALLNRNDVLVKYLLERGKFVSPVEDDPLWTISFFVGAALRQQEIAILLLQYGIIPPNITLLMALRADKGHVVRAAMQAGAVNWELVEGRDYHRFIALYEKELALPRPNVSKTEQAFLTVLEEFPELTREEIAPHLLGLGALGGYYKAADALHETAKQRRNERLGVKHGL